jgi:hypothetical protein
MRSWWLGALLLGVGVAAHAQEYLSPPPADPSPITDQFAFSAIYFFGKASTDAQINPSATAPGTDVNVENVFGVTDRADQFRAEALIRLEDRNKIRLDFLDLRRNGDTIVGQNIQFGTQTFNVGEEVKSEFDLQQFDITYTYSFLRGRWYELGAGLSVQFTQAEADGEVPGTPKFDNFSAAIPFAEPALDGTLRIARHWSFNGRAEYLHLSLRDTSGLLEDFHADLQYRYHGALALGVGYEYQRISADLIKTNPSGDIRLKLSGPEVFLRGSF